MCYEDFLEAAEQVARTQSVQVLLYNDRGVGASLGRQHSTGAAVRDARAALVFAKSRAQKVRVLGMSLGGGVMAQALANAAKAGELPHGDVEYFAICHSFTKLSQCVGQMLHPVIGAIARGLLWLMRIDNLDTQRALSNRLAQRVLCFDAADDQIIRGKARLRRAVNAADYKHVECKVFRGDHNDFNRYFEADFLEATWFARHA